MSERKPLRTIMFSVQGEPASKSRARFTRAGVVYTQERTRTAEEAMGWSFLAAAGGYQAKPDMAYSVEATFFASTMQRRDVDNMLKLVLDGLNKIAWSDDSTVMEVIGRKMVVPKGQARTDVVVRELGPYDRPAATCEECGESYPTYASWEGKRRFCSFDCRNASVRRAKEKACIGCGVLFTTPKVKFCSPECRFKHCSVVHPCLVCGAAVTRYQSQAGGRPFCSSECRTSYWRQHRANAAKGVCSSCSGPTSKKAYTRCRACVTASRAA